MDKVESNTAFEDRSAEAEDEVGLDSLKSRRGLELEYSEDVESTSEATTESWKSCQKLDKERNRTPIDEPVSLFNSLGRGGDMRKEPRSNSSATNGENDEQARVGKPAPVFQREKDEEDREMGSEVCADEEKVEAVSAKKKKQRRKKRSGGEPKEVSAQGCCGNESQCEESCRAEHCLKEKSIGDNFVPHNMVFSTYGADPCTDSCCGGNGTSAGDHAHRSRVGRMKAGKKKKGENVIKAREIEGNRGGDDVDTLVGFVEGEKKGKAAAGHDKKAKKQRSAGRLVTAESPPAAHNGETSSPALSQPAVVAKKEAMNGGDAAAVKEESATGDLDFTNFEGLVESQDEQPFEKYVGRKKKPRAPAPRHAPRSRPSRNGVGGPRGGRQLDT